MLKSQPLGIQNVILFGNRVIKDVVTWDEIILEYGRFLIQNNWCPNRKVMKVTGWTTCDIQGRAWSDAAASQMMLRIENHHQELRRGQKGA
jgi:hypothetical protein